MTQTIHHMTSTTSCDIYRHPDNPTPHKGYKNDKCRYCYTVSARLIANILEDNICKSLSELVPQDLEDDGYLTKLACELAKGNNYEITDSNGSEVYYANNLKEVKYYFRLFKC